MKEYNHIDKVKESILTTIDDSLGFISGLDGSVMLSLVALVVIMILIPE